MFRARNPREAAWLASQGFNPEGNPCPCTDYGKIVNGDAATAPRSSGMQFLSGSQAYANADTRTPTYGPAMAPYTQPGTQCFIDARGQVVCRSDGSPLSPSVAGPIPPVTVRPPNPRRRSLWRRFTELFR